jgi:hypothetical protein
LLRVRLSRAVVGEAFENKIVNVAKLDEIDSRLDPIIGETRADTDPQSSASLHCAHSPCPALFSAGIADGCRDRSVIQA